jgi:heat shock protein beta
MSKLIFLIFLTLLTAVHLQEEKIVDGFNLEERQLLEKEAEKFNFNADISRLMDIIINSLYTHKEVFIRELISNSSDACEKVRFFSIQNPEYLGEKKDLDIRIEFDAAAKTFSITDTGVGMTRNDLVKNLGTIAKTGTTAFIEYISKGNSLNLIGQFGVGFYSTYLVSNKVVVTSKNNDDEDQNVWTSTAGSYFTVSKDPRGNTLVRGTRVTLYLKEDSYEFVEQEVIKKNIKRFSEFINFPIYLRVNKTFTREEEVVEEPKNETAGSNETSTENPSEEKKDDLEVKDETEKPEEKKEEPKKKTKTVTDWRWEWELINENKPIWMRNKADITKEEYNSFYKSLTKDNNEPLSWDHGSAEGETNFRFIYYLPSQKPGDLYENYYGKNSALKLYVRRVLVSEQFEDLIPRYLNFIKGIVDSDDLPLNVSREQLQQDKMIATMSKKLVRKIIALMNRIAAESSDEDTEEEEEVKEEDKKEEKKKENKKNDNKYLKFYENFGKNIKLGIIEDSSNKSRLAKLLRFYSSRNPKNLISFDEYIKKMKPKQDVIYYLAGEEKETLRMSPLIQKLIEKDIDVLLLDDPIDEFCIQNLGEYEKRKLKNVARGDIKFFDDDEKEKSRERKVKEAFQPLIDWWKKKLGNDIEKVVVSNRLTDTPCIVVSSDFGQTANMERIQKAQAFSNPDRGQQNLLGGRKILEINTSHPAIKELLRRIKENPDLQEETKDVADLLYESALLASGIIYFL